MNNVRRHIASLSNHRDTVLQNYTTLDSTIKALKEIVRDHGHESAALAREVQARSIYQTCSNLWHWIRKNLRYERDDIEIEQLRTPARIMADGKGDCDCFTILICSTLNELGISNYAKVTAYNKPNEFEHIYPIAIDEFGRQIILDCVPEIPRFNHEHQPIINSKIYPIMQLAKLSGLNAVETEQELAGTMSEEIILAAVDFQNEAEISGLTESEQHDTLSAIDEEILQLSGSSDSDADVVLSAIDDELSGYHDQEDQILGSLAVVEDGLSGTVTTVTPQQFRTMIVKSVISQQTHFFEQALVLGNQPFNAAEELKIVKLLMQTDSSQLSDMLRKSAEISYFKPFYKELYYLYTHSELNGVENENIYLSDLGRGALKKIVKKVATVAKKVTSPVAKTATKILQKMPSKATLKQNTATNLPAKKKGLKAKLNVLKNKVKAATKKVAAKTKKVAQKAKKVVKKAAKVVLKLSPLAIAIRSTALVLFRTNASGMSTKLAYGYLTEDQANKKNLNLDEWRKFVAARIKFEAWWEKAGGSKSKLKQAIKNSKPGKSLGISGLGELDYTLSGLGVVPPAVIDAIVKTFMSIFKNIQENKLKKKQAKEESEQTEEEQTTEQEELVEDATENMPEDETPTEEPTGYSTPETESMDTESETGEEPTYDEETETQTNGTKTNNTMSKTIATTETNAEAPKTGFLATVQTTVKTHKKKFIIAGIILVIGLIVWLVYRSKKGKALFGIRKRRKSRRRKTALHGLGAAPKRRKRRTSLKGYVRTRRKPTGVTQVTYTSKPRKRGKLRKPIQKSLPLYGAKRRKPVMHIKRKKRA